MTEFFLSIVNMSISASWLLLAVLLLRLLLKKAPKWINVLLWGIAGLRLVMPFSFESIFSLIPSAETITTEIMTNTSPAINTGIPALNHTINPVISESFAPEIGISANPLQILIPIMSVVWLVGIVALSIYTLISFLRLKSKIGTAVLLRDNIFQSENVASPFVLGIIKPKIYLPFNISEQDKELVIAHENAHIRRKDHFWKPLGFLILTLHWFNPLVWLGYVLLCRDIELACDEKVVKDLSNEQRADYSQALLTCSINRRMIAACPLAFGEVSVKDRVKSVLSYKKPAFWIIVVAVVASVAVAVCFLTNPKKDKEYYDPGYSLQIVDETYIGTTQLPEKTDTYYFDVSNGTKGKLSNGARFEITMCNLQQGKLKVKLSGTALYSTTEVEPAAIKEIVVEEFTDGIVLTDKRNGHFYTFSFVRTQSLEEAVAQAIFDMDKPSHGDLGTELVSEGHDIYGTDVDGEKYKVYAAISYNLWGFENEYFVPKYDFFETVIMTFKKTAGEYELLNIDYPIGVTDSEYEASVKELFPKKYWNRVLYPTTSDYKNHRGQNAYYAQVYLIETGRSPEAIRYYDQLESVSPNDVGVTEPTYEHCIFSDYKYRYRYYSISAPFIELVGEDEFNDWFYDEYYPIPIEERNEMAIVAFIKEFNISREDFDRANAIHNKNASGSQSDIITDVSQYKPGYDRAIECNETYNADIIYTLDNEIINSYYLYVDMFEEESTIVGEEHFIGAPEWTEDDDYFGVRAYKYRCSYYSVPYQFIMLVGKEAYDEWEDNFYVDDFYKSEEMHMVSFIKHFNISRDDFDKANKENIRVLGLSDDSVIYPPYEYPKNLENYRYEDELNEVYDADLIYTFDNEKINAYYARPPQIIIEDGTNALGETVKPRTEHAE